MTNVTIIRNELAFINGQLQALNARKSELEALLAELEAAEVVKKEYVAPSIEVKVEVKAEELPAPPAEITVDMDDILLRRQKDAEEEAENMRVANLVLSILNHTKWCTGVADQLNIHLKQTPVDDKHPYPYTLWKEKIFEVDVYDKQGEYLATSPQFHMDALGQDALRYLRTKKSFGKYEPKTYEPKACWLTCNE